MKEILERLIRDYNERSELVALNYSKIKECDCDSGTLQWNRGHLDQIDKYLKELATTFGINLQWEFGEHDFGQGEYTRKLNYRTVSISREELEKLCEKVQIYGMA